MAPRWEPGQDEYLETMARFAERNHPTTVSSLALELGVTKSSASQMLRKMAKKELISFPRYGEPSLTPIGITAAAAILRKHRVIHKFLEFMGIRKSKIHQEACSLEHAVSDEVEKRMEKIIRTRGVTHLVTLSKGMKGKIERIDADSKTTCRLQDMGLTKGAEIVLNNSAPLEGPIELTIRGTRLAVGRKLALKIFVRGKS